MVDTMSPAALSLRRRDHWESREQAAELQDQSFFMVAASVQTTSADAFADC